METETVTRWVGDVAVEKVVDGVTYTRAVFSETKFSNWRRVYPELPPRVKLWLQCTWCKRWSSDSDYSEGIDPEDQERFGKLFQFYWAPVLEGVWTVPKKNGGHYWMHIIEGWMCTRRDCEDDYGAEGVTVFAKDTKEQNSEDVEEQDSED